MPAGSLQEVLRSVVDDMEEIEMVFDETQVRFRMGEIEITSKLIDGTYPNYRAIFNASQDIEVVLDKAELTRISKIAAVFSREVNQSIVCEVDPEKQAFLVSSISNEVGENQSEMAAEFKRDTGEVSKVKVDSRQLITALNVMEQPKVRMNIAAKSSSKAPSPILIMNEKNDDYRHFISQLVI